MADHDVDLFVIGAGSGGVRAARVAASHGARVMAAEEYRVGGTCVIRGCVPKKLLVYASRFSQEFEDAAGYGWTVRSQRSLAAPIANKDREIARLEAAYTTTLERYNVAFGQSPRRARRRPYRPAGDRRKRAGENDPDRDWRWPHQGPKIPVSNTQFRRTKPSILPNCPTPRDPGRRLYRRRIRLHLCRPRQRSHACLSRRKHSARLR